MEEKTEGKKEKKNFVCIALTRRDLKGGCFLELTMYALFKAILIYRLNE